VADYNTNCYIRILYVTGKKGQEKDKMGEERKDHPPNIDSWIFHCDDV